MADVDLHPSRIDNLQMGYLFEHLVMRFNEQANEEAGDHFTPREVIRLMANLLYTGEQDVHQPGIYRTIYDPACGTGGMLSVSEELLLSRNRRAGLGLYGQEYNNEAWAICCADMVEYHANHQRNQRHRDEDGIGGCQIGQCTQRRD